MPHIVLKSWFLSDAGFSSGLSIPEIIGVSVCSFVVVGLILATAAYLVYILVCGAIKKKKKKSEPHDQVDDDDKYRDDKEGDESV